MSLASSLVVVAVTVGIVVAGALILGFVLLVRRGRGDTAARGVTVDDRDTRARVALVRLDDEVQEAADELAFAVAQFGEERSRALSDALTAARLSLVESFALQQKLDDATPDTATQQREWRARILSRCETASSTLARERRQLDDARRLERRAPDEIDRLTAELEAIEGRVGEADRALARLVESFAPAAVAPVVTKPHEARTRLSDARARLEDARAGADVGGASSISGAVADAERMLRAADRAVSEVHELDASLARSTEHLATVLAEAPAMITSASTVRDSPPDPETGARVGEAVIALESVLARDPRSTRRDPDAATADLESALAALDAAVSRARSEQQRLDHARAALAGALLTARSQIATTAAYIGHRRGTVGGEARTRLAEAERLLSIAEAEADPVVALDTARSSATYSRDADALARYDLGR
ncbi:hypothetical protein [Marisediminicola sp. LYQ134]|uniref:hypothetical protein n=1 Tax=Marisediminicola sp. LYQ134 TaxID=3391061 RepID=UPI003983BCEF